MEIEVSIDILTICNYTCPYCYARKSKELWNKIIPKHKIDIILRKLSEMPYTLHVVLLGGEPSLHPDINYILDKLNSLDNVKKIIMYTNGSRKLDFLHLNEKLSIRMSLHSSNIKNVNIFFENAEYLISKNIFVHVFILMIEKYKDFIKNCYNKLKSIGVKMFDATYISNDNGCKVNNFFPEIDSNNMYELDGKLYDVGEIFRKKLYNFKNWKCYINSFFIHVDGTISKDCTSRFLGNIYNMDLSELSFDPIVCELESCKHICLFRYEKRNNNHYFREHIDENFQK